MPAPRHYALPGSTETVPSVSAVLAQLKGDYRNPTIDAAAERGSAFHALLAADLRDEDPGPIPEALARPWAAWRGWSRGRWVVPEAIEQPMAVGGPLGFGGTPDLIGLIDGARVAVDWKLRSSWDYHNATQVGAYAALWNGLHPDRPVVRGLVLRFDPNGDAPPEEHWFDGEALASAIRGFVGLLGHWHERERLKAFAKAARAGRRAA